MESRWSKDGDGNVLSEDAGCQAISCSEGDQSAKKVWMDRGAQRRIAAT